MELIHSFLNLVVPPFSFFTLMLLLPPFQFFKFFLSVLRSLFSEDVSGKVVLITGASSGIGEYLAYEYAQRGACLVLTARRERSLREVAERARQLGAPDALAIRADVSDIGDCRRVIDHTIDHYGRLDHLVNNAGLSQVSMLEEADDITSFNSVMDVNFWGSVYMTRFAAPHLRRSEGRIVVLSSSASWLPTPRMSIYNASKAAMAQFFETLRVEFGPDIKITIVTPGFIESELTQGKFINREGRVVIDTDMRDVQVSLIPVERTETCAKGIVNGVLRGQRYVTEPSWFRVTYYWKVFCPEVMEFVYRMLYLTSTGESKETLSKKLIDYTGAQRILYPESIQAPEPKRE